MMRRPNSLLPHIGLLCIPGILSAQQWAGVISPSRAVDWSNVGAGTIPARTTQCGATIAPYNGDPATINNALVACANTDKFVALGAGTFNLTSGIRMQSGVTLRGAGADQTFLIFTGQDSCSGEGADICMFSGETSYPGGPGHIANWTGGYSKGTTSITVDSTTAIVPNKTVIALDQANDANTDPGNIWVCETQGVCSGEGPSGTGRTGRAQSQIVLVTGISGNLLTVSPGLYMPNWSSNKSPGAYWGEVFLVGAGFENASIDNTNSTGTAGVFFLQAYNCWVKGIRSVNVNRSHVWFYASNHITIRDSYFYGTNGGGATSYGVEFFNGSDNLVENCIFQHIVAPMIWNGSNSGSVFAYNYAIDDYYGQSLSWMSAGNFFHSGGIDNILVEGNVSPGFNPDGVHGTTNFVTAFRNYFLGFDTGRNQQTMPILMQGFNRYHNIIGNVLGVSGYHNTYQCLSASSSDTCSASANTSIYTVGYSGNQGQYGGVFPNDTYSAPSLMRWGNYDVVTSAVRWCGNSSDPGWSTTCASTPEVPSGLSLYANAVPSSTNLPSSFYYSSKPSWWPAAKTWPPIGPDVSGGNIANLGGHAYTIPSQDCFGAASGDNHYATNYSITGASWSSGLSTVTVGSTAASKITVGSLVSVSGMSPSGYNCTNCIVRGKTSTTISYAVAGNPGAFSSGGTANWPVIASFNAATCYGQQSTVTVAPPTGLNTVAK